MTGFHKAPPVNDAVGSTTDVLYALRARETALGTENADGKLFMLAADELSAAQFVNGELRAALERWSSDSSLQTFQDRERFRREVRRLIGGATVQPEPAQSDNPTCPGWKHPKHAIKSLTTDDGMVYACERCSAHWFYKYDDV